MREHIEKAIIKSLAENPKRYHNLKVAYILNAQKQLLASDLQGDVLASKFMELDNEFHRMLFEFAGRPNVWDRLQAQRHHYDRFRIFLNNDDRQKLTTIYSQHALIYNLINQGKGEEAVKVYEDHVYYNVMHSTEKIMENSQYFKGFADTMF